LILSAAAGVLKLQAEELSIATERSKHLPTSVTPFLAEWIIRGFIATGVREIRLQPWVIVGPSARAGFERRIRDAVGLGDVSGFSTLWNVVTSM
jgi:hypothetical protein